MELVTGHAGTLHITAKQVSRLLRGVTATDESTVQRLNVGNNAAITYSGITMSIASGELLLDGYHVTLVDDTGGASGETLIFDATLESTNSRIDKVVLEIVQDNTTSYQRAEIVIVQGEESDSPVAPATPTEPESSTEEFLAVGVIAQVTITGDDISSLNDLTNLYGGSYVDLETFNEYISESSAINVKNLLPYPYTDTTKTVNGITFTDNGDGTITANGTATDTATFTLGTTSEYLDYDKSYILNGCPANGSEGTYYIQTEVSNWEDTGSGVEFERDLQMAGAAIKIVTGTTVSNLTFSPMIRLAVIEDDSYEPYAMTNQELTKSVQDIESDISETKDIVSDAWSSSKTYAAGEYCISGNKLYKCLIANTGTQPPNTTYWEETTCAEEFSELNSNLTPIDIFDSITIVNGAIYNAARCGQVVSICIRYDYTSNVTLATGLPKPLFSASGRKTINQNVHTINSSTGAIASSGTLTLTADGTITYSHRYGTNDAKVSNITYITSDN